MTEYLAEYIEAGLSLDTDERLEAAHQLLLSVEGGHGDQVDVEGAWDRVVARRVEEIVSGSVRLVDGPEEHSRIRAEITARRR